MADAYANVQGGKLKLKGAGIKKKKRSGEKEPGTSEPPPSSSAASTTGAGSAAAQSVTFGHTKAELRRLELQQKRKFEKLEKGVLPSHREQVNNFNKYLSNLTEHYDMPKVSKGN
ncbi:hypothetical protein AB1Y20_004110 [Prymnesium parvum]|uniref:Protein FAM32A n=1 Tax=Prymnesium parvum TaxID=97485 RepID=A0AB34J8H4_PRYPA